MILLDTHAWVWWVHGDASLPEEHREMLDAGVVEGIAVSIISCWEVAKLVEIGRLKLSRDVAAWFEVALAYPGVRLLDLTPAIVVESTRLPKLGRSKRQVLASQFTKSRRAPSGT